MILDDLSDFLTSGGMGTVYKDYIPPSPDNAVAIYGAGGQSATFTMSGPCVLQEPRIQVSCRSTNLETAHQNARSVYQLLNGLRGRTINGVFYHWIKADQEPVLIGRDQNARFTVACTYDIKKDRST